VLRTRIAARTAARKYVRVALSSIIPRERESVPECEERRADNQSGHRAITRVADEKNRRQRTLSGPAGATTVRADGLFSAGARASPPSRAVFPL